MNDWKLQLKMLLEKQGLSPDNPEDEASQQIRWEQENFISHLLATTNKSFIEIIDTKHQEILNKRKYLETKRPNIVIDEISEMFADIKDEVYKLGEVKK